MNPTANALRAVTGIYMRRMLYMIMIVGAVIFIVAYALLFWLAGSLSPLWWFSLVVLVPLTVVSLGVVAGLWYASGKVLPRSMSRAERQTITSFGSKLFGVVERGRLPYPLLLIMVGKDLLRRRESRFLRDAIDDSRSLKQDFAVIQDMFR
mgnify:FL=1